MKRLVYDNLKFDLSLNHFDYMMLVDVDLDFIFYYLKFLALNILFI